jgi:molybdate transport system ATP-binding protein
MSGSHALRVAFQHALDRITLDVDFVADRGLTALLGHSGAGKTRTLDVIAGLLRPDRGLVELDGEPLTDTARGVFVPPHKRGIGYVFQESRLFPHLTIKQNLLFGRWFSTRRTAAGLATPGPAHAGGASIALDDLVALLDLAPLLARHPAKLSGGERRRVALGRALLAQPRLLLLDEPLGSLDASKRLEILPYLDRLLGELKLPMIYVTHDWGEVEGRASQRVFVTEGKGRQEPSDRS